jgi:anti-sigma B factor antagonist
MDLRLEYQKEKDYTFVTVHGEIDLYNAKQLKENVSLAADRSESANLILDIMDVDYIDSTGLGILIGIKRRTTENNGKLVLVLRSERISKLFAITGLSNIFTIAKSADDAIEILKK